MAPPPPPHPSIALVAILITALAAFSISTISTPLLQQPKVSKPVVPTTPQITNSATVSKQASKLGTLAVKRFGPITASEQSLLHAVVAGQMAWFGSESRHEDKDD